MPAFTSRPLNKPPLHRRLKKYPGLFGIPFLLVMVGASFGLQTFTQTRYDLHNQKVTQMNREQELGLNKNRKRFDVREEYFKLSAGNQEEWEPRRIERPKGLPEWGVAPAQPSPTVPDVIVNPGTTNVNR
ncbi:cytochrome c oxidase assembly protein COX16-domain-containing protein [Multifurca ochricompacta]|uniref:Cytochrome c oxidase assembly protein COX16, mitochondrial n=1 Tax=Multifurca ochricompacta TaxID=376703 RepID=A0AAD4M9F1_9AGAM|nr:cytochrome c oxidase assembly protein COX16-domain-containing protein [Multifurca ochricompacta]